jgi:hypothetical protein
MLTFFYSQFCIIIKALIIVYIFIQLITEIFYTKIMLIRKPLLNYFIKEFYHLIRMFEINLKMQ